MHFSVRGNSRTGLGESGSETNLELYEKKWTKILLNWLTKCVNKEYNIKTLTGRWLIEIVNQYKEDIVEDDIERAILCTDDIEPFLKYKYPMLRLKTDEKDRQKKLFIMASMMLYHCCICSNTGRVERDLCVNLARGENEIILYFCKILTDMEITAGNIEIAIQKAVSYAEKKSKRQSKKGRPPTPFTSDATVDVSSSGSESSTANKKKPFPPDAYKKRRTGQKISSAGLPSTSVTVMPSHVTEGPSYLQDSSDDNINKYNYRLEETTGSEGEAVFGMLERELEGEKKRKKRGHRPRKEKEEKRDKSRGKGHKRIRYAMDDPCYCAPAPKYDDAGDLPPKRKKERKRSLVEIWNRKAKQRHDRSEYSEHSYRYKDKFGNHVKSWLWIILAVFIVFGLCAAFGVLLFVFYPRPVPHADVPVILTVVENTTKMEKSKRVVRMGDPFEYHPAWAWHCQNALCIKVFRPRNTTDTFSAHSRCILLCTGPQIWPLPIGTTYYKKELVAFSTDKLEYKFKTTPSHAVNQYLGQAFKNFLQNVDMLERMEKTRNRTFDRHVKKLSMQMDVQSDPDPRIRLNTDESYYLTVAVVNDKVKIQVMSPSFAGVKHGLETLTQMILFDQTTGYLITLSEVIVKDGPSYRYRGLMLDTARNFIPVPDILKTLDGMASCKLNTLHWRISDGTSFPLVLDSLPNLSKYGAYDKTMVYKKEDVNTIVNRAGVRAIRVLIEVAIPGPVGRAWTWSEDATCSNNASCENMICVRLRMTGKLFQNLEKLYAEIIKLTGVDDIFHLSGSIFSIANCNNLIDEREGFLEQALSHLKMANKGFMPTMPIIWYTPHLEKELESKVWDRLGVQLNEWPSDREMYLSKYKVIHSSKWDLSCDIRKQRCTRYRSWQEMYAWRSWRTIESYTIEGGEATLWTDHVYSGNLDAHLWPRAAAVAERLWSDMVINATATAEVYLRLDYHRWRMLFLGTKVEPIWPMWCSFNPHVCMSKVQDSNNQK